MITAEEANEIQREWMALDSNASDKEKKRVFDLMKKLPSSYIVQAPSGQASYMMQGTPGNDFRLSVREAEERAKLLGIQTVLRWSTKGLWINEN